MLTVLAGGQAGMHADVAIRCDNVCSADWCIFVPLLSADALRD